MFKYNIDNYRSLRSRRNIFIQEGCPCLKLLSKLKLLFSRVVNEKNALTDLEKQVGSRKAKFWKSTCKCNNEGEKRVR